jgi:rhamnosyltransferase
MFTDNMSYASIVIWYNPLQLGKDVAKKNIQTYSSFFKKVYIIDNSPDDNSKTADQIPHSRYIPNFANLGIAKALNLGCEAAVNDGYTWAMTMDQDSSWESNELSTYLDEVKKINQTDNLVSGFSPMTIHQKETRSVLGTFKHNLFKRRKASSAVAKKDFEYTDRVISSGNIINLDIWESIGKFNEDLFINDVDYEFCYRMIKNDHKIVKINTCKMYHVDGEPRRTFFPHAFLYHKERIYYFVRNKYYILKNYPQFAKKYKYRKAIKKVLFEKLIFLEFEDLKYAIMGIVDGRNNNYGKFCKTKK